MGWGLGVAGWGLRVGGVLPLIFLMFFVHGEHDCELQHSIKQNQLKADTICYSKQAIGFSMYRDPTLSR